MAIQCVDFSHYSQPILTVAALYAATAFLKHSAEFAGERTDKFTEEVRAIINQIVDEERNEQKHFIPVFVQDHELANVPEQLVNMYQS